MLRHVIAPLSAYTKVSHSVVRNPRLTSDAKVLLVYLQGLPESVANVKPLGEHATDLGMKPRAYQRAKESLAASGYLHEWRWQGGRGRWITEQLVANVTLTRDEATAVRNGDRSPTVPDPTVGGPRTPKFGGSPTDEDWGKTNPQPPAGRAPSTEPEGPEEPGEPEEPERSEAPERREPPRQPRPPEPPEASPPGRGETDPAFVHAEHLLLTLHHAHRDLRLGVREARLLAGVAAEWLRRGVSSGDLRHALTAHLPSPGVRSAVGFLRHRLVQKLPPEPLEAAAPPPPAPPGEPPYRAPGVLVDCQGPGKTHAFRPVADETLCRPCRQEAARRADSRAEQPDARPARPGRANWRGRVAEVFAAEQPGLVWDALDRSAGAEPSRG